MLENQSIKSHKLCGAGNGGFFIVFSEKGKLDINLKTVKLSIDSNGVFGRALWIINFKIILTFLKMRILKKSLIILKKAGWNTRK